MKYSIELTPAQYKRALKLLHEATITSILNKKPAATIKANKALVDKFDAEFIKEKPAKTITVPKTVVVADDGIDHTTAGLDD